MEHIYTSVERAKGTLVLLHGTGGNEQSMLPIAKHLTDEWNVLSVRGEVNENGALRFFKRLREGVLDEDDLIARTAQFHETLTHWANEYTFSLQDIVFIGYSNGANFAANYLLQFPNAVKGGILLHPMVPTRRHNVASLDETNIFISAGIHDPLVPYEETEQLLDMYRSAHANVQAHIESNGHQITYTELEAAKQWLATLSRI